MCLVQRSLQYLGGKTPEENILNLVLNKNEALDDEPEYLLLEDLGFQIII